MTATTALLGLLAQTSIHAGAGSQTSIIALPVQREGHNGYPCVFGSSVKGALRNKSEQDIIAKMEGDKPTEATSYAEKVQDHPDIISVYGAAPKQTTDSAGAMIVNDARLLLFPVRSLTSQFKWVTCPDVLRRYKEDSQRLDLAVDFELSEFNAIGNNQAIVHSNAESLFLEEYRFEAKKEDLNKLITALTQLMQRDGAEPALQKQLVIVSNDSFTHLVNHATPVNAHIALDSLSKTTTGGALWYEETLPPETLLYIGLIANASRRKGSEQSAADILKLLSSLFDTAPYLQIGGNETVGMGWCIVKQRLGA